LVSQNIAQGEKRVVCHTDGACRGNPGPGGWGVILRFGDQVSELSGAEAATTNNRMELTAALRALQALKRPCRIDIHSDSKYVIQGMTEWLPGWVRRGWVNASREPVKNRDLWEALSAAAALHEVHWHWVRGHSGDPGNERADALANAAIDALQALR
jgi:ribonuclease HI